MRTKIFIFLACAFCLCGSAFAGTTSGTLVVSQANVPGRLNHLRIITMSWTSDASGDVVSNIASLPNPGEIVRITFDPSDGATSPTASYDVVLTDFFGFDVLTGLGANLSQSATLETVPSVTASSFEWPVYTFGGLNLAVSNAGNVTQGVIRLYIKEI